jgi:hypothetical protein
MTLRQLWVFLAVGLPVLGALLATLQSVDLAYHLRAGAAILDTGSIPRVDTFTFTAAGSPWQDQQWGAEVLLAAVYRLAGWTGLVVLRAALVGVLFGIVFDLSHRGHSTRTAALLTLAAFSMAVVTLALRPQLLGMVLFAATLWLVVRRHDRPRAIWLVVPIAAIWANVHGSFVLAPVLLGLAVVEDVVEGRTSETRPLILVGAAVLLATLVNPFGPAVWQYAIGISTNPQITSRISEWQRTSPLTPEGFAFFASVALVAVVLIDRFRRSGAAPLTALVWLLPFAGLALWTVRGLAWWPLVAAVTLARLTAAAPGSPPPRERSDTRTMRRLNAVVATVLVIAAVALLPVWRVEDPGLRAPAGVVGTAPSGITAALRTLARPADRLFAPQPWGSWFEFAIPDTPVFIDSRIELFPAAVWDAFDAIVDDAAASGTTLDRWGVTIVATADGPGGPSPLASRLDVDQGWQRVFADVDGRVYVRSNRPTITN